MTPEHPFYVKVHRARDNLSSDDDDEGEWRNADQLQAGDFVRRPSGEWVAVVEVKERAGGERVYNFEVEGNHNYYVGDVGVLVHNSCFNKGGRFADVDAMKAAGEVGHHMPQNAYNAGLGISRSNGPALGMSITDHALTRSYRGRGIRSMIEDAGLSCRERLLKDVQDIRKHFGSKYNEGLLDMLNYAKTQPRFNK